MKYAFAIRNSTSKNLKEIEITGGDGNSIKPGDGIICSSHRRAADLIFGIYLGIDDKNKIYYRTKVKFWNGKTHEVKDTISFLYSYTNKHKVLCRRVCGIPAENAEKGMLL
jgi:hypothetical protein